MSWSCLSSSLLQHFSHIEQDKSLGETRSKPPASHLHKLRRLRLASDRQTFIPTPIRTPGATNPDITPDNIHENICNPNWSTKSIRPPVNYTNRLKIEQIQEYADADTNPRDYEEDHLIPLEIGGNPTDPRNLWPEPYDTSIPDGGARYKDKVENYLHKQVCAGNLTLDQAQKEIANDWYRVYTTSVR